MSGISNKSVETLIDELRITFDPHKKSMLEVSGVKISLFNRVQGYVAKRYRLNPGQYLYRAVLNAEEGKVGNRNAHEEKGITLTMNTQ